MAVAKSIDFSEWPGLKLLTVSRHAEDRLVATAEYGGKAAADANLENAKASLGRMAEFMTEDPFVREGEVIGGSTVTSHSPLDICAMYSSILTLRNMMP